MLSHADVRRILDWNLEYFRTKGVVRQRFVGPCRWARWSSGGAETVDWVLGRAEALGTTYSAAQVHAVLDAQMLYLEAIGAIGPEAPPGESGARSRGARRADRAASGGPGR